MASMVSSLVDKNTQPLHPVTDYMYFHIMKKFTCMCSIYYFDPEAKTIILSSTFCPLCQLFGFFRKRISHVLQLLVEFVHFIFTYATFSRFASGAFQGLLRQKRGTLFECHCILMVILSNGTATGTLNFYKVI